MEEVIGQKFEGETILLGGRRWTGCEFIDCTVIFDGEPSSLERCNFVGRTHFKWQGAALNTLQFLTGMVRDGGGPEIATVLGKVMGDPAIGDLIRDYLARRG